MLTSDSVDVLRGRPERRRRWESIVEAGNGRLHRYDGTVPCNVWIVDEHVLIEKSGPDPFAEAYGVPIVSRSEAVRSWADRLVDGYRAEATRLEPECFAGPAPATEWPRGSSTGRDTDP